MLNRRQKFGEKSESTATAYLRKQGYKILLRNYQTRIGEIDIIARDRDTIVFIEVKARRSSSYGDPKYAVTRTKQKKISMVALEYLKSTDQFNVKARFDVVSILTSAKNPQIELVKNAFNLAYG